MNPRDQLNINLRVQIARLEASNITKTQALDAANNEISKKSVQLESTEEKVHSLEVMVKELSSKAILIQQSNSTGPNSHQIVINFNGPIHGTPDL